MLPFMLGITNILLAAASGTENCQRDPNPIKTKHQRQSSGGWVPYTNQHPTLRVVLHDVHQSLGKLKKTDLIKTHVAAIDGRCLKWQRVFDIMVYIDLRFNRGPEALLNIGHSISHPTQQLIRCVPGWSSCVIIVISKCSIYKRRFLVIALIYMLLWYTGKWPLWPLWTPNCKSRLFEEAGIYIPYKHLIQYIDIKSYNVC